jgi:ribosomal protein S18 acetylase RimI-like enzyme
MYYPIKQEVKMKIRILNPKDAEAYQNIRLKALKDHPEAFSASFEEEKQFPLERFENRLIEGVTFTFGAFIDEQLMGVVTLVLEQKNKLNHRANIVGMYVDTEKRRSGIGKRLMGEAIGKAKEIDVIEQIYLTVTSSNAPAKKLYQTLGFETYGVDKRALKLGNSYFDDELEKVEEQPVEKNKQEVISFAANKKWLSIPENTRKKLERNVFCSHCLDVVQIEKYVVEEFKATIVLHGSCKKCGNDVARVID